MLLMVTGLFEGHVKAFRTENAGNCHQTLSDKIARTACYYAESRAWLYCKARPVV